MPRDLEHGGPKRSRLAHRLLQNVALLLAALILAACIVVYSGIYYAQQQRLPGGFELTSTLNNTMPLVMAAVAQTIVVLTRGIDLSVGGVIDLTNALAAVNFQDSAGSMIGWTALILLVGALCGLLNGLLVGLGRLQPILVTLATLSIFQGLAIRILPQPGGAIPPSYTAVLANGNYPFALLYLLGIGLLWLVFRRTSLGIAIFAIGNDERAAEANGVRVIRTKILAYVLSGVFSAAAGLYLAATATAGDATTGNSFTLASIVAVVLGGVSLFGGRGSAVGAVLGALITTMIVNILFFAQIDPLYQSFYEGLFLVIAVLLAAAIGRYFKRRR
ncbi:MAG TPA: ABC transporter permease [Dongiaceae bacterium]|nr:ABC transporter permease [Dongiaceae bacterium]